MQSHESTVSRIEQLVERCLTRDEVLNEAVRILKQDREQYDWVGIYLLEGNTLVLHNYIGKPTEHTRIEVGNGACGVAVAQRANQVINDVTTFDNYIACSLETRSEIVVLIREGEDILGQIDIDSDQAGAFSLDDEMLLEEVAELLARTF